MLGVVLLSGLEKIVLLAGRMGEGEECGACLHLAVKRPWLALGGPFFPLH